MTQTLGLWSRVTGACVVLLLGAGVASADTISGPARDPGRITGVGPGVKELDLGGQFLFTYRAPATGMASTDLAAIGGLGLQYFLRGNVSVGLTVLGSYESLGAGVSASGFGGAVASTYHIRLGLGAFLRPTAGLGLTFGEQRAETAPGTFASARSVTPFVRIGAPVAYFVSPRVVLTAGPDLYAGMAFARSADGGTTRTTRTIGGFSVGVGYVF